MTAQGRFETLPRLSAPHFTVLSGDPGIPFLGQLTPAQLSLGDALEPGPLGVVHLDIPLGSRPLGQERLWRTAESREQ